jgi:hypothetical protein
MVGEGLGLDEWLFGVDSTELSLSDSKRLQKEGRSTTAISDK